MDFSSTEYPISWFKDQYGRGNLIIKPPYQRKPVWSAKQKCYLIESILLDLPIPEIYIQMTTTAAGDSTYAIVDGQQRTRSVLQFIGCEQDPEEQEYNKFRLDKLEDLTWRNKAFSDLSDDEKKRFYAYKFAVRSLKTEHDQDVRDMFRRLNKYLTPLNAQELRNATYSGPFIKQVEKLADDDYWAENKIVSAAQIRRMKDLEFVSNLLIGVLHGPQAGASKIVDDYYKQYEEYDDGFPGQRTTRDLFRKTHGTIEAVLPMIKESRWGNMTDFYTLFVGIAALLRDKRLKKAKQTHVRQALTSFEKDINARLADESKSMSEDVVTYVRAVEKGANDKKRRADRHGALLNVIGKYFT